MDSQDMKAVHKGVKTGPMAGRNSDPLFYSGLSTLPNPDPILRKLGRSDEVYDAIASDAHVKGELRSIRAGLLKYQIVVNVGGEGAKEKAAADLCREWFKFKPAPNMTWPDVIWNMGTAVFKGRRIHELVWDAWDNYVLPVQVLDRPNRRFIFDNDNRLRLLTRESPINGIDIPDYKFLLTRHMPSSENPYGEALFSSCYWPYVFKHGGWKFFFKFAERFGLPWPVGRYPQGTPEKDQIALATALQEMLESGVMVVPDGNLVELLEVTASGELAQERIIELANREMSMALTSQSLISNQRDVGARAATETFRWREQSVHDSDTTIIEATFNAAFEYITLFNFGEDVLPPTLTLFKEKEANENLVRTYQLAAQISDQVDLDDFHRRTGIKKAEKGSATLKAAASPVPGVRAEFASGDRDITVTDDHLDHVITAADTAIADGWITPAYDMLLNYEKSGKTLKEFLDDLPKLYGQMDDQQIQDITSAVLKLSVAQGMKAADA